MRRHSQPSGLRRRITALLSLPILLLVLTGCFRAEVTYEIGSDGNSTVHAQGVALSPVVTRADLNCQDLVEDDSPVQGGNVTAQDYEEDGLVGCTVEASGPTAEMTNDDGSYMVTQDGDVVTFTLQGDPTIDVDSMAAMGGTPDLTTTVVFPGDVIDGGGGEVDGNEVTFTGIEHMRDGITATGSASAGFLDSLPGWALWVAIGVAVLIVVLIIVLVARRGGKKKRQAAAQQGGGYGGAGYGGPGGYGAGGAAGGYGGQQQWGGQGQPQQGWDQGQQWGAGSPSQAGWDQGQQWGQGGQGGQGGQPQQGWGAQSPDQGQQGWGPGGQPPQQGQGWS